MLVAVAYYGFLLMGAYAPGLLARPAIRHVPWSFISGAGLLVGAVAAAGLYVLLANAADRRAGEMLDGEGGHAVWANMSRRAATWPWGRCRPGWRAMCG